MRHSKQEPLYYIRRFHDSRRMQGEWTKPEDAMAVAFEYVDASLGTCDYEIMKMERIAIVNQDKSIELP